MRRLVLVSLFSGACGFPTAQVVDPPEGAAEATATAWALYGETDRRPPEVRWVRGECDDGYGFWNRSGNGSCIWGQFFPRYNLVFAVASPEYKAYSVVHELLHASLYDGRDDSTADPDHSSARWAEEAPVRDAVILSVGF